MARPRKSSPPPSPLVIGSWGRPPRGDEFGEDAGRIFTAKDIDTLNGIAGKRLRAEISPDEFARALDWAFNVAITREAGQRKDPPPSEIRDYLDGLAKAARDLLRGMGLEPALLAFADPGVCITAHGYRHMQPGLPTGPLSADTAKLLHVARLIAPDAAASATASRRRGTAKPASAGTAILNRALERAVLGLALIVLTAERARDSVKGKTRRRGAHQDVFRRTLMRDLARLYHWAYGVGPNTKDSIRERSGPAARWIKEVLKLARGALDAAQPTAVIEIDGDGGLARRLVGSLARCKSEVLAAYLERGWQEHINAARTTRPRATK